MTIRDIPVFTEKDKTRFWANVDKTSSENGCWLWVGRVKGGGYGSFFTQGRYLLAHRVSFVMSGGAFERGKLVLHGPCGNRRCVNPAHLSSGTHQDNSNDMRRDGTVYCGERHHAKIPGTMARGERNGAYTHPERLPRGERHGMSKLTATQVTEIRDRAANGETGASLGLRFGVSKVLACMIIRNKIWRHV